MAYSEALVNRIEKVFAKKSVIVEGKKFMGGYCFFMDKKMCVGLDINKQTGQDRLIARVGDEQIEKALDQIGCRPMDITGRPMKGFVFIDPSGFNSAKNLNFWVQLCVDHNPFAKRSKKKNKSK